MGHKERQDKATMAIAVAPGYRLFATKRNPFKSESRAAYWAETSALSETSPSVDRFSQSSSQRTPRHGPHLEIASHEHGALHGELASQAY